MKMGFEGNSSNVEVPQWLKNLPVAPEYHPTLAEFQDPILYIFKIEKEASKFGICKIVPPVNCSLKKIVVGNLNRSLLDRGSSDQESPVFFTRQQQIGFCPRRHTRPVQKAVWESGESYTLGEFEAKSKGFERSYFRKNGKKCLSGLEIESVYWKATLDKPFSVEYANDMPGSCFSIRKDRAGEGGGYSSNVSVGETEWNMRGVSRAKGSLLRFMKEEIPGVTSPMVYIAMLFSWFAWHVEDHDLHSLNYLHTGAGKTWYGVPRDAAVAFEEVVRVDGYGGEINPLVTFATLAKKTTIMSPEVLVDAGVPCCRLVQNPGEFVVTFPRAYHSGFSHGFNCGEASNIATPEWLMVAKDAAVRRASINCPPMVSHFQLLYDLALSLCSRVPKNICMEPRSSRLKDKKKGEGDILVKDLFVHDVLQNNSLFHIIAEGSSVIVLPRVRSGSTSPGDSRLKVKDRFSFNLCSPDLVVKTRKSVIPDSITPSRNQDNDMAGAYSVKGKLSAFRDGNLPFSSRADKVESTLGSQSRNMDAGRAGDPQSDMVSNQGHFSCVTCGILCFSSVAIIQPTETASQYLILEDYDQLSDCVGVDGLVAFNEGSAALESNSVDKPAGNLFDIPIQTANQNLPVGSNDCGVTDTGMRNGISSLGLLAMTYGDGGSESEDDCGDSDLPVRASEINVSNCVSETTRSTSLMHPESKPKQVDTTRNEDSSRMHIFCLQHAVQAENQLRAIGGAHVVLLCHPDYPMLEAQAKQVADDLGTNNYWNNISYREASFEDEELIRSALDSEEAIHGNGDWAVKLGINLYYTANLSRSPLYSKQLPYNSMIYSAFGRKGPANMPNHGKWSGRHRKGIVAGKWCGKVWTASRVHPMLTEGEPDEQDHIKSFPTSKKPGLKIERPSEGAKTDYTSFTSSRKSRRKKKAAAEAREVVKAESSEAFDSPDEVFKQADDSPDYSSFTSCKSRKKRKAEAREVVRAESPEANDSPDETFESPQADDSPDETFESPQADDSPDETFESPQAEDSPDETFESPQADDIPDELFGSPRISIKRPKIFSSDMKMWKETFEPQINDKETDSNSECELEGGPNTRLRKRSAKPSSKSGRKSNAISKTRNGSGRKVEEIAKSSNGPGRKTKTKPVPKKQPKGKFAEKGQVVKEAAHAKNSKMSADDEYQCDIENCSMSFVSKQELVLHKRNICPVKGCGKTFFSHKYLVQHRRVHMDDRPLKCPWKGCKMTFKWAWARTEHIRVHTGERPYECTESGCGQTFRFVSDFSRHKRKTGHSTKKVKR